MSSVTSRNMFLRSFCAIALGALVFTGPVTVGQEPPQVEPDKNHAWLKQFEGTWETTSEGQVAEGQPAVEMTGRIESRMIGEFWVINKMTADFGGMTMEGSQTIGFDKKKGKFIGTWVDMSSGFMWHYEGSLDESGKILTLQAEGPSMSQPGETANYRDIYEFVSDFEVKLTSSMESETGEWVVFMSGVSRKVK